MKFAILVFNALILLLLFNITSGYAHDCHKEIGYDSNFGDHFHSSAPSCKLEIADVTQNPDIDRPDISKDDQESLQKDLLESDK